MNVIHSGVGGGRSLARLLPLLFLVMVGWFLVACSSESDESSDETATPAGAETVVASTGATASATAEASSSAAVEAYLIASDAAEEHLYVFAMPAGELVATFDHVELAAHTGALVLPDGRVLFMDDHDSVLRVLDLNAASGPALVASAALEPGQAWSAVDPDLRYYAGSSRTETEAMVDIVDLTSMAVGQLRFPVTGEGETHVALGGEPLSALVWSGGSLYSYPVDAIMAGTATEPVSTIETGPGAHSQAFDPARGILWTSLPEELHGVRIEGNTFGEELSLPWASDGLEGGRVGRLRLSYDGNYLYGTLAATVPPEGWVDRQNDFYAADLERMEVKRMSLHPGISGRWGLSVPYAFAYSIHPEGDEAILIDVDSASSDYLQEALRVDLPPLASGPVAGEAATGKNARGGVITPDGRWAFVSNGGEGTISVIDTSTGTVTATLSTPTALAGGGYLVAWQPDAPLIDLIAR